MDELQDYAVFGAENFLYFSNPSFKLILFVSVDKASDLPGIEVFEAFEYISKSKGWNRFEMELRTSKDPMWNSSYFASKIPKDSKKVFLSTPDFNEENIKDEVIKSGINSHIIQQL